MFHCHQILWALHLKIKKHEQMILSFFIAKYYDCFIGRFFPSFAQTVFANLHVEDVCEKHEPQFVKVRNFSLCSVLQKKFKISSKIHSF